MIGQYVEVVMDRPLGSIHPKHPDLRYEVNYGYIPGVFAGDGEEQDAYVLGVDVPLQRFCGKVIAIIVPGPCRYFGLFGRKDDYVIPWHCICRIGPEIVLVDINPENCRVIRGRPKLLF